MCDMHMVVDTLGKRTAPATAGKGKARNAADE